MLLSLTALLCHFPCKQHQISTSLQDTLSEPFTWHRTDLFPSFFDDRIIYPRHATNTNISALSSTFDKYQFQKDDSPVVEEVVQVEKFKFKLNLSDLKKSTDTRVPKVKLSKSIESNMIIDEDLLRILRKGKATQLENGHLNIKLELDRDELVDFILNSSLKNGIDSALYERSDSRFADPRKALYERKADPFKYWRSFDRLVVSDTETIEKPMEMPSLFDKILIERSPSYDSKRRSPFSLMARTFNKIFFRASIQSVACILALTMFLPLLKLGSYILKNTMQSVVKLKL
jgi:hypothetical protein